MIRSLSARRYNRMTYPLLSWILKLTVLGNPDVDELQDVRELNGRVEVEALQCGTYVIAQSSTPRSITKSISRAQKQRASIEATKRAMNGWK